MNINFVRTCLIVSLILSFSIVSDVSWAQSTDKDYRFNLLAGYSFSSVKFLGKTPNAETQFISLGFQQPITKYFPDYSFWYTADIIPHLHYFYPKRDENGKFTTRSGFGFSPVGFLLTKKNPGLLSPYIKTSGGIILMDNEFPTDRARRLNFTFDITAAGNIKLSSHLSLSAGYTFHHISNAETGSENPGLDSNLLFLKLTIQ